MFKQIEYFY